MSDETDTTSEVARVRAVTEFNVTYFGLSDLEADALMDLYADHAYKFAERHKHETPLVASRSWPTVEAWEGDGPQEAQIAIQEPAGATQGRSGDSRASGGLDEAPVDPLDVSELLSQVARLEQERDRLENEVHGLEQAKDQWRDSANVAEAQVEAIRAAITREAAHGEAITRSNLVAERFQTVLDSVSAP